MAKSIIFFGITRGGSSITNRLLHILASSSFELNDIDGRAYEDGIHLNDIPSENFENIPNENIYVGPFRQYPGQLTDEILAKFKKVIIFRDPRDCLVSHYHAFKNIHTSFVKGKGAVGKGRRITQTIDEYVLDQLPSFLRTFKKYISLVNNHQEIYHYRYEDIIADPLSWISEMINVLELSPSENQVSQAVLEASFSKVTQDVNSHNRQGMWGDFLSQLQDETIQSLNDEFAPVLEKLSYTDTTAKLGYGKLSDEVLTLRKEIDCLKKIILKLSEQDSKNNSGLTKLEKQLKDSKL
jgi:hypothetical protein